MSLFDLFGRKKSKRSQPARRPRPRLEVLEDRVVPATSAFEVTTSGLLFITGTNLTGSKIEIKDDGTHIAGNIRIRLDGTQSFEDDSSGWVRARSAINAIHITTGAGADTVRYRLTNDLVSGPLRDIQFSGGENTDVFTAEVNGDLAVSSLRMIALGGGGDDRLSASILGDLRATPLRGSSLGFSFDGQAGNDTIGVQTLARTSTDSGVTIDFESILWMNLWGGDGSDTFNAFYAGHLHGKLLMHLEGGNHNDRATARFFLSAESTGAVGDPGAGLGDRNRFALVDGGAGNDVLHFEVRNPNPEDSARVSAQVIGGSGLDQFRRTRDVARPEAMRLGEFDIILA